MSSRFEVGFRIASGSSEFVIGASVLLLMHGVCYHGIRRRTKLP